MIALEKNLIKSILPVRKQDSNKGDFGKVLCLTGSSEYIGAGLLSALSVLRAGAGYSILCSDENAIEHYKNFSCDLIYKTHKNFDFDVVKQIIEDNKISVIILGCGIGLNKKTLEFTYDFLYYAKKNNINVVVDADGLNCLSEFDDVVLNENFVLTPHPTELARLLKINTSEIQNNREQYAKFASGKYNAVIVLKGKQTLIANHNSIYINTTGNSSLAKAGTGDVLAGMIGSFIAQGKNTKEASELAVYLHGLSAEIYSSGYSEYTLLASELISYIPLAFKQVLS